MTKTIGSMVHRAAEPQSPSDLSPHLYYNMTVALLEQSSQNQILLPFLGVYCR